jgi:hypothetical protein
MIEVKIDLVPFGIRNAARQIGYIKIVNDGTGNAEIGNYYYEVEDEYFKVIATGEYKNFHREEGIFSLLEKVLNDYNG